MSVAGCGGSPSEQPTGFVVRTETSIHTGTLSKPKFLTRIQAYCRRAWRNIPPEFTSSIGGRRPGEASRARFVRAMRDDVLRGLGFHIFDAFRILGAPPGDETAVEEMAGSLQETIERGQRLKPIRSTSELAIRFATFNRLARRYGLRDCPVTAAHLKL